MEVATGKTKTHQIKNCAFQKQNLDGVERPEKLEKDII
jgi:hypothetical protein